jgi:hypothetical protein
MAILESRTKTGLSWVKESVALFKLYPRKWLLLALAYVGFFMMMPSLPGFQLFALITILVWPIFIAVASRMYKNAELNINEDLSSMIKIVQPKISTLMLLGLTCLIYGIVVNYFLNADIQSLTILTQGSEEMSESQIEMQLQKVIPFLLKLSLFLTPLMMATWFSPMLIAYNNYSLVKAIKSSIAGSLQHMIAIAAAWLLLTAGIVTLMLLVGIVVGVVGAIVPSVAQLLMSLLVFSCLLLASALMLAFQYVSYRDVFRAAQSV